MRPTDLAEALFKLRCFLEQNAKLKKRVEAIALVDLESFVTGHLRNLGHDPGRSAEDADALKLSLIHAVDEPKPAGDEILRCLEDVVDSDNVGSPYRVVGRWAEFVNRAVLGPMIVADDPFLPVFLWVKARGIDTQDFTAMARAFAEWSREATEAFEKGRR